MNEWWALVVREVERQAGPGWQELAYLGGITAAVALAVLALLLAAVALGRAR